MFKRFALLVVSVIATSTTGVGQSAVDRDMVAKIRTEGLEHSQVSPVFETLTIDIGPRLTASPAHRRAVDFVRDRLASYGLANVHVSDRDHRSVANAIPAPAATNMPPLMRLVTITNFGCRAIAAARAARRPYAARTKNSMTTEVTPCYTEQRLGR